VIATVALGFASIIYLPFYGFDFELELAYDSKAFTSTTNDFFERKSIVLCKGLLWKPYHFLVSSFIFPLSFFVCGLDWLS
jgi:hypothetical protein